MDKDKILHLFQCEIPYIMENLNEIRNSGWTSILLTPTQASKEEESEAWYMRYQVIGLTIGNRYGTKEQIIELCKKAHAIGINIYVDIIVTHFANAGASEKELIVHKKVDKNLNEYLARDFKKVLFYARPFNDAWKSNRIKEINFKYQ